MQFTGYPHWGSHSGFSQLAQYLDHTRFSVRLRAASDSDADLPIPHAGLRRWLRKRVQRRGMAWYKLSDLAAEMHGLPGCIFRTTDILHFLDGEHCPQYLPALLKRFRLSRTRTIATYHQPPELLDDLINRDIVSHIDQVTLVSPAQVPYFREFLSAERIEVVLHGIDTDFFKPPSDARRGNKFNCVTSGHWLRDWIAIRRVAEDLIVDKNIQFHIVTNRDTGLDHLDNVIIHRNIDDRALRSMYQQSDVLFLPLTHATANNTLLEGIACGLPVVSSSLPSIHAYLPNGEGMLVKDNDKDLLVEAILRLRSDSHLRLSLGRRARIRAEELSWRRIVPQYETLYSTLAEK
jgi:glycosyltransferase involved in cell wall biosynthesis